MTYSKRREAFISGRVKFYHNIVYGNRDISAGDLYSPGVLPRAVVRVRVQWRHDAAVRTSQHVVEHYTMQPEINTTTRMRKNTLWSRRSINKFL